MITQSELSALVEILNRCPVTQAERLWLQALLERLLQEAQENCAPIPDNESKEKTS